MKTTNNSKFCENKRHTDLSVAKVLIGLELAKKFLEGCPRAVRRGNKKMIAKYAEAMKNGLWEHGGIILVDEKGMVLDGWMRLLAIIESGIELEFIVIRGCNTALANIDSGLKRTPAQNIRMAYPTMDWVTGTSTATLNFIRNNFSGAVLSDNNSAAEWLEENDKQVRFVERALRGAHEGINIRDVRAALTLALIDEGDYETIEDVCHILRDPEYHSSKRILDENVHELYAQILYIRAAFETSPELHTGVMNLVANVVKDSSKGERVGKLDMSWCEMPFPYYVFRLTETQMVSVYAPAGAKEEKKASTNTK